MIKCIGSMIMMMGSVLLTACVQTSGINRSDNAPPWLNGEPESYPNSQYLSASGSASNLETAQDRALSNLAKIFEVQIQQVSSTREHIESQRKNDTETVSKQQTYHSSTNLYANKMISGARIAKQWLNSDDLTYYALAVLDRTQAGNNIRQQMQQLDKQTRYLLQQAKSRSDRLLEIADLASAWQLQQNRQLLQKTLKVIDLKGRGRPPHWQLTELKESLNHAMRGLPLNTGVTEDTVGGLAGILQGAARQAGFRPAPLTSRSGYWLEAAMQTRPTLYKAGWYWLQGNLRLTLRTDDKQTVVGYKSWPLKVSAQNEAQLKARMSQLMAKTLKQALFPSLLAFIKQ